MSADRPKYTNHGLVVSAVTIGGLKLSANAVGCLEAAGVDAARVRADVDNLRARRYTGDELRAECLNGAEGDDVIAGWNEYVDAVEAAAAEHAP